MSARATRIPSDVEISYFEQGEAGGVPLVLIHGYADSWRSFEEVLQHLPTWIRAIALSLRGHGDSSRPSFGYSVGELATDVLQLMDSLELRAAVLVGGSSGGLIARHIASHSDRALGVIFLGSPFSLSGKARVRELFDETISKFEDPVSLDFITEFQQSTLAHNVPAELLNRLLSESAKVPARVWAATLAAFLEDEGETRLGTLTVPCLAIWGSNDSTVTRADQEQLVAAIPIARLVVYEGAGHGLYWEQPERVASDIREFIEGLAPRL